MTKEEYNNWKNNNPQEWNIVYDSLIELFIASAKGKKYEDYMYHQLSKEKSERDFSYGRVAMAILCQNDCFDDLMIMRYRSLKYKKII